MKQGLILIAAAAGLALAACETTGPDSMETAKVDENGEPLICRTERETGKMVGREVCYTREEIKRQNQTSGSMRATISSTGAGRCGGKGNC